MKQIKKIFFIFCFPSLCASAQEMLTLNQAIEIALKNNHSVLIAKSQSNIAANNTSPGNAGMLPQINLNASGNTSVNNTQQRFSTGVEIDKPNVKSTTIAYGPSLIWTLFDGMKMFVTYDKLKEQQSMSELGLKIEIENTIVKVITSYCDLVRQKQLIKAAQQTSSIYEEKEKLAQERFKVGLASQLDVMQAKLDVNMQNTQRIQLQTGLQNSKSNLNQLLARRADVDFDATDSLILSYDAKYEDMINLMEKQNNSLLFSQKNIKIFDYSLRELKTQRSPIVGINLNYNFSRSQNQAGLILLNQNKGFNAGFTATWNLFNGFELNRQIKNSTIQVLISKYEYDVNKMQIQTNLITTFRNYEQAKTILKLEEENMKMVEQTIKIALEAFRIGKISSLELKDVQKSFDDVQVRVINARYDAKIAEAQLMHINGVLVK